MSELELLSFPLHGRRLIEASAGTGKTYSITALHLRALLGVGIAAPLPIDRVLVMTFTDAATDSLRERVRGRLQTARLALAGLPHEPDDFVAALLPQLSDHAAAERLLRNAVTLADTAAIHTLHGFCMRALSDGAFASGVPFAQVFNVDDSAQLRIACMDAWRALVRHEHPLVAAVLLEMWKSPDELQRAVAPVLRRDDVLLRGVPEGGLAACVAELVDSQTALRAFAEATQLPDTLQAMGVSTAADQLGGPAQVAAIRHWMSGAAPPYGPSAVSLLALLRKFCAPKLLKGRGKQASKFAQRDSVAELRSLAEAAHAVIERVRVASLAQAIDRGRDRLRLDKLEQGFISADDLLRNMLGALQGARGERFAASLRERYPIAMVDEFQDTDSVQWAILERIYPQSSSTTGARTASKVVPACILIGDPKQSIYGFRGADVYSYLHAAGSVTDMDKHELTRSFRASPALVRALNRIYRDVDGFAVQHIDYRPVESAVRDARITRNEQPMPALTFQVWPDPAPDEKAPSRTLAVNRMARAAAWQIHRLLQVDETCIDGKRLQGRDVAVLVRSWWEGRRVRDALQQYGLDAAFRSRDSVFASDSARELRLLLRAATAPEDEGLLRGFMLTVIGGVTPVELRAHPLDSPDWQRMSDDYRNVLPALHSQGVLAWLRQWMRQRHVGARLRALPDGRRRLTDLRHVCELLELEWRRSSSVLQVLNWLEVRIAEARNDQDENRLLRLDSDEGLISILTLHGAKGLEYGVVFLPTLWTASNRGIRVVHEERGAPETGFQAYLDLDREPGRQDGKREALARREQLAEELRMLYVGLTRARRACFVGISSFVPHASSGALALPDTALGHLLFGAVNAGANDTQTTDPLSPHSLTSGEIVQALSRLQLDESAIAVQVLEPASVLRAAAPVVGAPVGADNGVIAPATLRVRTFPGRVRDDWRVTSYSSIVQGVSDSQPGLADEREAEAPSLPSGDAAVQYRFPRGPVAGTLLHKLLEQWGVERLPLDAARTQANHLSLIESALRSHGLGRVEIDIPALAVWIDAVWQAPILPAVLGAGDAGGAACLSTLRLHVEVEFSLPLIGAADDPYRRADSANRSELLLRVLRRHGYASGALRPDHLRGMLRGFMDAVFECNGRYFILDYKSNYLGPDEADYAPAQLAEVMRTHRYDLQLLIYAVALRRWLRVRGVTALPEALYWFIRGVDAPAAGIYHHAPRAAVLDELDAVFNGASA